MTKDKGLREAVMGPCCGLGVNWILPCRQSICLTATLGQSLMACLILVVSVANQEPVHQGQAAKTREQEQCDQNKHSEDEPD